RSYSTFVHLTEPDWKPDGLRTVVVRYQAPGAFQLYGCHPVSSTLRRRFMSCPSCSSDHRAEFASEIFMHHCGFKNRDKPDLGLFPTLSICLNRGFLQLTVPAPELALLAASAPTSERAEGAGA